jgi:glycosyltransferase involved in cell wall biosynthesis
MSLKLLKQKFRNCSIGCDISIIAPCLNEEEHLPDFLSSLANQKALAFRGWHMKVDEVNYELIVIDGGSRDRSRSIIDSFRDKMPITGLLDETRNLGYVRNRGARAARGEILFFTNSDAILAPGLLEDIFFMFLDPQLAALSGRTIPINGGAICSAGYAAFDVLRWGFCKIGIFSPSGNFLAVRSSVFWAVGGFPKLRINEDGVLGQKLSKYARLKGLKVRFSMDLAAAHYSERFQKGALKSLMFYAYVFGNFSLLLRRILSPLERRSSHEF